LADKHGLVLLCEIRLDSAGEQPIPIGAQHGSAGTDEPITFSEHLPNASPRQRANYRWNTSRSQPLDSCADIIDDRDVVKHVRDGFVIQTAVIQAVSGGDVDIGDSACKVRALQITHDGGMADFAGQVLAGTDSGQGAIQVETGEFPGHVQRIPKRNKPQSTSTVDQSH